MIALTGPVDANLASPRNRTRLPLLDGVRGMAALCVLGFHVQRAFHLQGPFASSYLFVDLFFLLSGFVLGLVAEPKMCAGLNWSAFMAARCRRLWPMIAVGALLGAIHFSATTDPAATDPAAIVLLLTFALLMVPIPSASQEPFPLNGPQWSLAMELLANLAHALLLARLSARKLIVVMAGFGVLLLANILWENTNYWLLAELRVGFSYSLGLVFARGYREKRFSLLAGLDWQWVIVLLAGTVLALPYLSLPKAFGEAAVIFGIFPAVFLCAIGARLPANLGPAFLWLGRLSYPLYAVHEPIIKMMVANPYFATNPTPAVLLSIALAAVLGAAFERRRPIATARATEATAIV
jgi:peptidoglycan/LPS O-acetylase OafA/YrhL